MEWQPLRIAFERIDSEPVHSNKNDENIKIIIDFQNIVFAQIGLRAAMWRLTTFY